MEEKQTHAGSLVFREDASGRFFARDGTYLASLLGVVDRYIILATKVIDGRLALAVYYEYCKPIELQKVSDDGQKEAEDGS